MSKLKMPPIAVTGVGALFPGGGEPDAFWQTILSGKDCIRDVPPSHWLIDDYYDADPAVPGKTYARRGAFLDPVDFDPIEHGIPPNLLPSTDTAQLLALIVAKRVLDSGCDFGRVSRERTAVVLGVASATELVSTMSGSLQRPLIEKALRASRLPRAEIDAICDRIGKSYVDWTESTFPGLLGNVVAGRIANRFDLGGMNCVIDAACASSLGAVKTAVDQLWTGAADMVITGGVDAINDIFMYMCFSKTLAMSRRGDCRPFSDEADGTMLGEGIGMFALRRLEDAERDGDRIYAVLRGIGASSDGKAKSIYAPRPEGQAKALRRAYETAAYDPGTVELVEAHGTGTVAGDAAEVAALKEVFGEARRSKSWCALGSIKSQIGHTKAAAGAASLYKAVMALHHKVLPPTIKVTRPNSTLGLEDSPFYLNTQARPWIGSSNHPRRASVSSFGFGGSNFHLTLEEYRGPAPNPARIRTVTSELFLFSAESPEQLADAARAATQSAFAAAARQSHLGFKAGAANRLAIVATDSADLLAKVGRAIDTIRTDAKPFWNPLGIAYGVGPQIQGKTAFLFPGQGSQYVGMGAGLAMAFESARLVWDATADLAPFVFPPPAFTEEEHAAQAARLTDTRVAQPCIGVASHAVFTLFRAGGLRPDFAAGHSFGELTALFCAGVLSSEAFLEVSRKRGALMAIAAKEFPNGAMAAIAASEQEVHQLLEAFGSGVVIANVNSPRQTVVAGFKDRVEAAIAHCNSRGVTARLLSVATAFHSPIVEPAAAPFKEFLESIAFNPASIPVYANTTGKAYSEAPDEARELLGNQLAKPVRFADEIAALYDAGARIFIEVGPGSVLTDLTAACLAHRPHLAVASDAKGKDAVTSLWFAFARLAAAGVAFNMEWSWEDYDTVERESRKSAATVAITGTNYGKRYPNSDVIPDEPQELPTSPKPVPQTVDSHARLEAIRLIQEKMADAHASAQRAMTESHLAYLKASEQAMNSLLQGQALAPLAAASPITPMAPMPVRATVVPAPPPPQILTPAPPPLIPTAPQGRLEDLVLTIIAEQTGYPRDILAPEMDLEADLGIDSIKRVQILAAIAEKRPDLPAVEASEMAAIRTIGAITRHLDGVQASALKPAAFIASISRLGLKEVDAPPLEARTNGFTPGHKLAIVGSSNGIGVALANRLQQGGIDAGVYSEVPADAKGTVFLDFESDTGDLATHAQRAFAAAKGFARSQGTKGGRLIMARARGSVWSGMSGLARTIALEYPECSVRSIEVEEGEQPPTEIAERIAAEILSTCSADVVTIHQNGRRTVLQEIEMPLNGHHDSSLLEGKPVVVASGGALGVTAACLIALAEIAPLRLVLLGRTAFSGEPRELAGIQDSAGIQVELLRLARANAQSPTPKELSAQTRCVLANREICRTITTLKGLGSEAIYLSADVTDAAAVATAMAEVRRTFGPVQILIHAAGVLADKSIAEKSAEQFLQVFAPKVLGLRSLLDATVDDPLRFICLFSSVAGRYGNVGQADYAMANAALNQIAREEAQRRGGGCIVRALNWGPWDGGMVTPELRERFASKGIPVMPMTEGVTAFVRELQHPSHDSADVDVVLAARSITPAANG